MIKPRPMDRGFENWLAIALHSNRFSSVPDPAMQTVDTVATRGLLGSSLPETILSQHRNEGIIMYFNNLVVRSRQGERVNGTQK